MWGLWCVCVCEGGGGGGGGLIREWRQAVNVFEENIVLLGEAALEMTASSEGTSLGFVSNHVLVRVRPLESRMMTQGGVGSAPGVQLQSALGSLCVTFTRSAELTRLES